MNDRRALFFLVFALVAAALIPVAESKHRWVAELVAVVYAVLAAASALDAWSKSRS